jgi:hypothetical protein
MVRTVTRKTPNKKSTWYRLGKSANKKVRKSSSSRRKELNKLKSMKKVTKRILEEKLKKSYLHDGYNWKKNTSPKFRKPIRLKRDKSGKITVLSSSSKKPSSSSRRKRSSSSSRRSTYIIPE